jgi:hypothetical protein
VLTQYPREAIPPDVAVWYGDEEIVPVLHVANGVIDPGSHPGLAAKLTAQARALPQAPESD